MKFKTFSIVYLVFILMGLLAMAYATWHFFALTTGQMGSEAYCELGGYFSCERVTTSAYGSIAGWPISIFGFVYLFALGVLGFTESVSKRLLQAAFVPALLACLYLIYILLFELQAGCINCYAGYLGFFGAFACSFFFRPVPLFPKWMMAVLVVFAIGGNLLYAYQSLQPPIKNERELARFAEFYQGLPVEQIPEVSPFKFKEDSPKNTVTIIEFADYACPACAQLSVEVMKRIKRMPGVQFVFYPYPLDKTCYPDFEGEQKPGVRCDWTMASFCAHEQGKFWELHDYLFELTLSGVRLPAVSDRVIKELGLNVAEFDQCRVDPETQVLMDQVLEVGTRTEIKATPTFFINGKRHRGGVSFERMYQSILEEQKMNATR